MVASDSISDIEQWKPIPGFEHYEVSDHGFVRRRIAARRRWPAGSRVKGYATDYVRIGLFGSNGEKPQMFLAHNLVMLAFVGPPPPGQECNHINGEKHDNRLCNLEYVTRSDNLRHAFRTGLHPSMQGENTGASRLTDEAVLEIRRLHATGGFSLKQLGSQFGVHFSTISLVVKRKTWKHI